MSEPRTIATVHAHEGYAGILAAFRARADQLNASRTVLNEIAGLTPGHLSKLLAGLKSLGPESWGPTLGAHGMAIAFIEDPEAMKQIASRLTPRNNSQVRMLTPVSTGRKQKLITRRNARKMVRLRMKKLPRWRRIAIARKAAKMRWMRVREARRAKRAISRHPASTPGAP